MGRETRAEDQAAGVQVLARIMTLPTPCTPIRVCFTHRSSKIFRHTAAVTEQNTQYGTPKIRTKEKSTYNWTESGKRPRYTNILLCFEADVKRVGRVGREQGECCKASQELRNCTTPSPLSSCGGGGGGGGGREIPPSKPSVHLRPRREDERSHRSGKPDVDRHHFRADVLHGVEEGQAGDDRATGAVDVQVDGLGAVFGVEVLKSGERKKRRQKN